MIVSLEMMFGRLGSLLGNIFFPALMGLGCVPPFFMISSFMLGKWLAIEVHLERDLLIPAPFRTAGCLLAAFLPLKNKAALK